MSDIPEDVMKAAAQCYEALPLVYDGWDEDAVRAGIAQAILAERERCAKIADEAEAEEIAAAIRSGVVPQPPIAETPLSR